MKKFNITVNGTAYEVEVEEVKAGGSVAAAPKAAPVAAPVAAPAPAAAPAPKAAPAAAPAAGGPPSPLHPALGTGVCCAGDARRAGP